jgi:hypothetical protein
VKAKLRAVAGDLETLDEVRLTDQEETSVERDLAAQVTSLWQTPQVRDRRPEVTDEALNVQWYLENTLFEVIDEVYDALEAAVDDHFDDEDVDVPKLYEFRSWAGSDRDGNPFVTPEITEETLDRQRAVVLPIEPLLYSTGHVRIVLLTRVFSLFVFVAALYFGILWLDVLGAGIATVIHAAAIPAFFFLFGRRVISRQLAIDNPETGAAR